MVALLTERGALLEYSFSVVPSSSLIFPFPVRTKNWRSSTVALAKPVYLGVRQTVIFISSLGTSKKHGRIVANLSITEGMWSWHLSIQFSCERRDVKQFHSLRRESF